MQRSLRTPRSPRSKIIFVVLWGVVLAACARSPKTTFHTLSVEGNNVSAAAEIGKHVVSLGVGPVTLPGLLKQPGVVLRKSQYAVDLSTTHEWGGQLEDELLRALTRYFELRLPRVQVQAVPWESAQAPRLQVVLDLDQFDGVPGGKAVLRGRWILQNPTDGVAISITRVALQEKVRGTTVDAVVEAQSKLVLKLGERILRGL